MTRPNLGSNKGVVGIAILKRDIEDREFVHTPSESENYPYDKMKRGQLLGIRPNLSTLPLTYGCYLGETFVFGVGSPLAENAEFYFSTPPLMPKEEFDVDVQRELTRLYLNQLLPNVIRPANLTSKDELTHEIELTDMTTAKLLFRSLLVTGYLPTHYLSSDKDEPSRIIMTFALLALLNPNYIELFLHCYTSLPSELFEDY